MNNKNQVFYDHSNGHSLPSNRNNNNGNNTVPNGHNNTNNNHRLNVSRPQANSISEKLSLMEDSEEEKGKKTTVN
jgi:hypothetical protein